MSLRSFNPEAVLKDWSEGRHSPMHSGKSFEDCIKAAFNIPRNDAFVYRTQGAETTLAITQRAIGGKRSHGLHGWYHDKIGNPVCYLLLFE